MNRGLILFLSFAVLILAYQAIKGWRLGLVRQIVRFGALAAACAAAYFWGGLTVPFLRPLGYPDFFLRCIGGAGLGLLVFLAICFIGGVLFKRTAHQDMGLVWFFYGATGALIGIAFGLVLVLFLADAVRFLGGIAEAQAAVAAAPAQHAPAAAGSKKSKKPKPRPGSPVLDLLVEMKTGLESHWSGEILQTLDPLPKKTYAIAGKIGRTLADRDAMARFFNYPGAAELVQQPEIQALRDDPEILRAARDGRPMELLRNPKIIKAANSRLVAAILQKIDLEKALDYALKK